MNLETEVSPELWRAVQRSHEAAAWTNVVLDAIHFLSDAIRRKSGLQSDGAALIGQALGGKTPPVRLNRLESESERNVQLGMEQLLRGVYQAIRNPRSHERLDDSAKDAEAIVVFIDYLLRVLGHARDAFSIEGCVARLNDEHFVPDARYADLVLAEIPIRKRRDVALAILHQEPIRDGSRLRVFVAQLLGSLTTVEQAEFFDAVSELLRDRSDDTSLRLILQVLSPPLWSRISEAARIRSEHRIIRIMKTGRYDTGTGKCPNGAVGTWAVPYWGHFTQKDGISRVLIEKLGSADKMEQEYVLHLCAPAWDMLSPKPPPPLDALMVARLRAGDSRMMNAMMISFPWDDTAWSAAANNARAQFKAANEAEDDDLPF